MTTTSNCSCRICCGDDCSGWCLDCARHRERLRTINVWIRVLRIAAIGLGVWGALYLLSGDRTEGAQPPVVSTRGVSAELPEIARSQTGPDYTTSIVIQPQDTFDFAGVQFYTLHLGSSGNAGAAMLSLDGDLALAKWLRDHRRDRVQLVLRVVNPLTRDGAAR